MHSLSKLNPLEQQAKDEYETRLGKMIGLENAAIKTLKNILSLNEKEQKADLDKRIEAKVHLKFNRRKTKKLFEMCNNSTGRKFNKSKVNEIATKTENMALATISFYLFNANVKEQDRGAYKLSKFLCVSQDGNSIEHNCCHFY